MDINIDLSHTVIQTERLVLRAWKESDTTTFLNMLLSME